MNLIPALHHYNKCTTPAHMRMSPIHWTSPTCEGVLCTCCVSVINLTFSLDKKLNEIIELNINAEENHFFWAH